MANPNPQPYDQRFKGVRDLGYSQYEKQIDPTDVIKFGKRVNYESKLTSDVVMEEHLKQMREKMENSKVSLQMRRQQEKEFLAHINKLEELEKFRHNESKKAINDDFMSFNNKMVTDNQEKRKLENFAKNQEKYNYFPFVSGDLIERHRAVLGAQLKNDLQSYLDYSKDRSGKSISGHSPAKSLDARSVGSFYKSVNAKSINSTQRRAVKELFDSEYVKPEDNYRVFQDSNPLKQAAMKEALSRYETSLKKDSQTLGAHLKDHQKKIEFDDSERNNEKEIKLRKQQQFKKTIEDQMLQNVSKKFYLIYLGITER